MSSFAYDPFERLTRSHTTIVGVRVFDQSASFLDEYGHIWWTSPQLSWPLAAAEIVHPLPYDAVLTIDDWGHVLLVEPDEPALT